MAQAESHSITRRSLVGTGIAALAATGAVATGAGPDPIFGAIEAHRIAYAALLECLKEQARLERALPLDRRKTFLCDCDDVPVAGDDPRWIVSEQSKLDWHVAIDERARDLLTTVPTTTAGVIALLHYADEVVEIGHWPDDVEGKTWSIRLHHSLADALERMA